MDGGLPLEMLANRERRLQVASGGGRATRRLTTKRSRLTTSTYSRPYRDEFVFSPDGPIYPGR